MSANRRLSGAALAITICAVDGTGLGLEAQVQCGTLCRMADPVHTADPPRWKTLIAFAIIYLVWGSTFYAIRVGVHEVPPLLLAAARFTVAGGLLFIWAVAKGERAEERVPSGTAAVILATIPAFMALAEILFLRTERLTMRLGSALLIGLAGVVVLVDPRLGVGGAPSTRPWPS